MLIQGHWGGHLIDAPETWFSLWRTLWAAAAPVTSPCSGICVQPESILLYSVHRPWLHHQCTALLWKQPSPLYQQEETFFPMITRDICVFLFPKGAHFPWHAAFHVLVNVWPSPLQPNLSPCNFQLSNPLKKEPNDNRFQSDEDVIAVMVPSTDGPIGFLLQSLGNNL
jgi:hypothetical protein